MTRLQALIFDVDGTLADTEEVHRQAFNRAFHEFGLAWDWTPACYQDLLFVSGGRERIMHCGAGLAKQFASRIAFEQFVRDLHRRKTEIYAALLSSGQIRLRQGVERLIHEARQYGVVLGIATSSAWTNLKTLLDNNLSADWSTWFAAIETADTVGTKKPSPAVYNAVLRRIKLDPRDCVAVEDTENGLQAASAAGLCTLITTHRFTRTHNFAGAAAVLDGLGEPERPMAMLHGENHGYEYVNLGFLDQLLHPHVEHPHWEQQQMAFA